MTLVMSVHSKSTFWLLADRRLSGGGQPPRDDAMKILAVEATDGVAVLGYSGLGKTPRGTEPSSWMSATLRGRVGTVEQLLGLIAAVASKELPRFLPGLGGANTIIAPAFVDAVGPQLFMIENVFDQTTGKFGYRFDRELMAYPTSPAKRMAIAGSGEPYLTRRRAGWERPLLRLVKHHDAGKVSEYAVADFLAGLNYDAHRGVADGSVGPRSVVIWRRRPGARRTPPSGNAYQFYSKTDREGEDAIIPSIARGMDTRAVADLLMQTMAPLMLTALESGVVMDMASIDWDEQSRLLGELPDQPDERLR